jgi:hypothetical protein
MIIKREEFLEELQLREQVRRIIKIVKKRKQIQESKEEQRFRAVIRELISEQEEAPAESGRATGIKVLDEEVLQNIIPIFKKYYFQLDNPEKRESFRSHIINAAENLLNTADSGPGAASAALAEPGVNVGAPIAEQDVSMAVGGGARDDPMYIPMADEATADPEAEEQEVFRTGLDSELTPDEEVGALRAQTAFNGPDTTIKKAYKDLRGDDAALFREYLITNLKLHFDTMEEELSNTPEPTTPSYEEEAAAAGGEELPPAPEDIELPTEAPPGAPMV